MSDWQDDQNIYRDKDGNLMCSTCNSEVFGGICDCMPDTPPNIEREELREKAERIAASILNATTIDEVAAIGLGASDIVALVEQAVKEAEQKPVGDALEVKVAPETMQAVMSRIKMTDKNVADRVLEPLWRIEAWRNATGDEYDYEVQVWKLRILARLTRRFNWAAFLLKPDNLDCLKARATPHQKEEGGE